MRLTENQVEILDHLSRATSFKTADTVYGSLVRSAMNLADKGILNLRLNDRGDLVFWVRQDGEASTGAVVPAGFVVGLNRHILEPSGKQVNFFLGRIKEYDLTQKSFRLHLSRWLRKLGLSQRDVIQSIPVDQISYDEAIFKNRGHVIFED